MNITTAPELRRLLDARGTRMPVTGNCGDKPGLFVDVYTLRALLDAVEAADRRRRENAREIPYHEPCPTDEWIEAEDALNAALDVLFPDPKEDESDE